MHTYSKKGYRKDKLENDTKVKKGLKVFYTKLKQIDELTNYLKTLENPVTEDNIDLIVSELIGRDLDSIEKSLILNRLTTTNQGDESENN